MHIIHICDHPVPLKSFKCSRFSKPKIVNDFTSVSLVVIYLLCGALKRMGITENARKEKNCLAPFSFRNVLLIVCYNFFHHNIADKGSVMAR